MITNINLIRFRNYLNIELSVNKNVVVLYGNNGEGKTNVLEAISMLANARGLRKATSEELINKNSAELLWNIDITVENEVISVGFVKNDKKCKKVYKINGKVIKNLDEFRRNTHILWMTYETDRLFMQSPANRRDFIDMFCNSVNSEHSTYLRTYEKLIHDRMIILKNDYNELSEDTNKWLDILEEQICDMGLQIAKNRIKITQILENCQLATADFPIFTNEMTGLLESEILNTSSESEISIMYKKALKERRMKDSIVGATTLGPNRSDWSVHHVSNNINANQCSAGEQKMLLIGIFLSFIISKVKNDNWIILLDDVIAHLDAKYSNILLSYITEMVESNHGKICIWLSGTSSELFSKLDNYAQFFEINDGKIYSKGR